MTPKSKMLDWSEAQTAFPSGHLVSGYYDRDRLNRVSQIGKLIERMPPKGRFAVRATVEKGEHKVEVLFELETDARRLGDTLNARQGAGVPGYGSHRWVEYTPLIFRKITQALKG